MKVIKDNEELKSYIKNGSIIFNESIVCNFNIDVFANIKAWDIKYYAFCISYNSIECVTIKGERNNSFHKCLDGKLIIKEKKHTIIIDGKEIELSKESFKALKESLNN